MINYLKFLRHWNEKLFIVLCCIAAVIVYSSMVIFCGPQGDSGNTNHQQLDKLKNRTADSKQDLKVIDLTKLFDGKNDTARFSNNDWVTVTGYIVLVKEGGKETCNCHSADKSTWDWHIEISATPVLNKKAVMICEVTQYTAAGCGVTYPELRALIGQKVQITGWAFHDIEHWQNSFNTNPTGGDLWRGSDIEIHPVKHIKKV